MNEDDYEYGNEGEDLDKLFVGLRNAVLITGVLAALVLVGCELVRRFAA